MCTLLHLCCQPHDAQRVRASPTSMHINEQSTCRMLLPAYRVFYVSLCLYMYMQVAAKRFLLPAIAEYEPKLWPLIRWMRYPDPEHRPDFLEALHMIDDIDADSNNKSHVARHKAHNKHMPGRMTRHSRYMEERIKKAHDPARMLRGA